MNFGTKLSLPDSTSAGPALADANGQLFIAWVGTDKDHHLNLESSSDGVNFGNKVTLPETSVVPRGGFFYEHPNPALIGFDGSLYIAWQERDSQNSYESSTNGVKFGGKVNNPDFSPFGPALASLDGSLYLGWRGTEGENNNRDLHITHIASATDALTREDGQ